MSSTERKILIATFGSLGDLHPFVALGQALKREGFAPVIATSEEYRDYICGEGLGFAAARPSAAEICAHTGMDLAAIARRMAEDDGFLFRDLIFPFLRESFDDLVAASDGAVAIVAHALAFAGRAAAEKLDLPLVNVRLSPMMLYSPHDPPLGSRAPFAPPGSALGLAWNRAALWAFSRLVGLWAAPLRRFRRDVGLTPAHGLDLLLGETAGLVNVGLFSPVLAAPAARRQTGVFVAGHSFHDRFGAAELAPELEAFLAAGDAPIVFTLGSIVAKGRGELYSACIDSSRALGRRVLLLAADEDAEALRRDAPEGVHVSGYAPHSLIFPRACVIVHHGGIGTSGQALRAGAPQLVTPFFGDQYDNAERLRRLGVARRLDGPKLTAQRLTQALAELLHDADCRRRAGEIAAEVAREDGAANAARCIAARLGAGVSRLQRVGEAHLG